MLRGVEKGRREGVGEKGEGGGVRDEGQCLQRKGNVWMERKEKKKLK